MKSLQRILHWGNVQEVCMHIVGNEYLLLMICVMSYIYVF